MRPHLPDRPSAAHTALAVAALLAAMVGTSLWAERHVGPGLLPHGFCFTWLPGLLWLHVISDALIGLAYVSIPVTLWHFVRRRTDLPFNGMFLMFGLFIVSCGLTHFLGIWTVWQPDYWLDGSVKAFTAAASVVTAGALIRLVPRALALPTVEQLRRAELERARAEAARAQAEADSRDKDVFIAMLSHELRNPLAPIVYAHRILQRTQAHDETGRRALEMATRQTAQLGRLVDDLLDASRLVQGRIDLRPARIAVQPLLADVVASARPAFAERGQTLALVAPEPPLWVDADPARLVQVVENLLSNASRYSDPGGRAEVTARADGEDVVIEVRDDGMGIEAGDLERVFELFAQVDRGLDRARGGLGIGLALVRRLVGLHGGRVSADSDGPGTGSTFTVRLPRRDPPQD